MLSFEIWWIEKAHPLGLLTATKYTPFSSYFFSFKRKKLIANKTLSKFDLIQVTFDLRSITF